MKPLAAAVVVLVVSFLAPLPAAADTEAERMAAADRYLGAVPLRSLMSEMMDGVLNSGQLPVDQKEFVAEFWVRMDIEGMEKSVTAAMVKHFTVRELDALADFYGSDTGQSILKKMGPYMAEVMPYVQGETIRVMRETVQDLLKAQSEQRSELKH